MKNDSDKECGQVKDEESEKKRKGFFVNPQTLKLILATGPVVTKVLHLVIELVKLFKS